MKTVFLLPALLLPLSLGGLPGSLVESVAPETREQVAFAHAAPGPDDTLYLWAAFHTVEGNETGGILKLDPHGAILEVLAEKLLPPDDATGWPTFIPFGASAGPELRVLEDGRLMVARPDSHGALIDAGGQVSEGFFNEAPPDVRLIPQFERHGYFYFIVIQADNARKLVRQAVTAEAWSPEILSSDQHPLPPRAAVPGPNGQICVLGSQSISWQLIEQKLFWIDSSGDLVSERPPEELDSERPATLDSRADGGIRLTFGPPLARFFPGTNVDSYRVKLRSGEGDVAHARDFWIPAFTRFAFAEAADGTVLASGPDGTLRRWLADGSLDEGFTSPGHISRILSLDNDTFLLDGTRRILVDGTEDPAWQRPGMQRPGSVTHLLPTPDGGLLAAGGFQRAGGEPSAGLVKWNRDGTRDETFVPDRRFEPVASIAIAPDESILIATGRSVTLAEGKTTDIVRLLPDGEIDESFVARVFDTPVHEPFPRLIRIGVQPDGRILVGFYRDSFGVGSWVIRRLLPNGAPDSSFPQRGGSRSPMSEPFLVLSGGSFFIEGTLHNASGEVLLHVDGADGRGFHPLCQMPDGTVIFAESSGGEQTLRRWHYGRWDAGFDAAPRRVSGAAPAGSGKVYVWGTPSQGELPQKARLVRLDRNGRIDPTFRAPELQTRQRRAADSWITFSRQGLVPVDPEAAARPGPLRAAWFDNANGRLWLGGEFNTAAGESRDGLAVLAAGNVTGFHAWSEAALRDAPEQAGPAMTPANDGVSNLAKYATGADPLVPDAAASALNRVSADPLSFEMVLNPEAYDITPSVEISDDLITWLTAHPWEVSRVRTDRRLTVTLPPAEQRSFIRVNFRLSQ